MESNIPEISEIIVVFDGHDNTPEVAKNSGVKVKVLRYERRLGQGGAVFEGFRNASSDIICFVDADGATPWYEVRRICHLVGPQNPAVIASRWVQGSSVGRRESLRNVIGGRVFYLLAFLILGVVERDSFCGLKAFTREVANELVRRITISDRSFNPAIVYHLKLMKIKSLEVGVEWVHKDDSKLPVGLKAIVLMFMTIVGLRITHSHKTKRFSSTLVRFRDKIRFY